MDILGRFLEFKKVVPESSDFTREDAVKTYLALGGVLKVDNSNKKNPKLVYPDKRRINFQLNQLRRKKESLNSRISELKKKHRSMAYDSIFNGIGKVTDPLYWEHLLKMNTDSDYKKTYSIVEPPINMMKDKKWRKMARMFVKNKEYRDRLLEAKTSKIGKGRDTVRETIEKNLESSKKLIRQRLNKLEREREIYDKKEKTLLVLLNWAE